MSFSRHAYPLIVQVILILALRTRAQYQTGFISIDCGSEDAYTDKATGISYASDEGFIETGENRDIVDYKYIADSQQLNVRSFPVGTRNCYTLKPEQGKGHKYLIRAKFMYGNYDSDLKAPTFELHLGPNLWDTVVAWDSWRQYYTEIIHIPLSDSIDVCLVNIGKGIPFISALELRPITGEIFIMEAGTGLYLFNHYDLSAATNQTMRYKDDPYDRLWYPFNGETSINISTNEDSLTKSDFNVPFTVMSTAYTQNKSTDDIEFNFSKLNTTSRYFFYMHFAELEKLTTVQTRQFNIYINDDLWYGPVVPSYLYTNTIRSGSTGVKPDWEGKLTVSLKNTYSATLAPIINAMEVYVLMELPQHETNHTDVEAISNVKLVYGLNKIDWQGDPCVPITYKWSGLNCSYSNDKPRIVSLNLSSTNLTGEIAPSITNLSTLEYLDLSNNKLEGIIPEALALLPLKVLNLEGNNFTEVPQALLSKKDLDLRIDEYLCMNSSKCSSVESHPKKKSFVIPIVASVAGGLLVLLIILVVVWKLKIRRKPNVTNVRVESVSPGTSGSAVQNNSREERKQDNEAFESKNQQFTYSEITDMTNHFQRVLGEGGFGKVYYGFLNGKDVAVKMLSSPSIQGHRQFHTELKLLLRVHHKNLTTLVGYCNEEANVGLIYEYMAMGNLRSHITGNSKSFLNWEDRLRIAIDTAQGIEYLHNGCKPPIIHRDIKSTNILLNEVFQAKLGDFGLSKIFPLDGANRNTGTLGITTSVAGTPGYLDPEYYITNWLNEKSDVYSFGVVLLEMFTGRPVLAKTRENNHIIQRVTSMLAIGDITNILDPRLEGFCDINTVWKAIEIAMACVSRTSKDRPTMSRVSTDLKECLRAELARKDRHEGGELSKDSSVEMFSRIMVTEYSPSAR